MFDTDLIIFFLIFLVILGLAFKVIRSGRKGEWLHVALTSIGDGIVTTDRYGNILTLNDAAEKLTGWTSRRAHGRQFSEIMRLVDHDTRASIEDPVEKAMRTRKVSGWTRNTILLSHNDGEKPIDYNAAPIIAGSKRIKGVIIIFRDITERYMAEQRLLESEDRLKAITNEARIGLVMIDRERRYVYANNFYQHILGISHVNLIGKRVGDILPVLYEKIRPNLDRAFSGERLTYELSGSNNKEKGLNRYYSVTYEPQARQSLIMNVVIVIVDITDLKHATEALKANQNQSVKSS